MTRGDMLVLLVKPQFEVGKARVGKRGVVKDIDAHRDALEGVCTAARDAGLVVRGMTFSPIKGPEGNIEFWVWASRLGTAVRSVAGRDRSRGASTRWESEVRILLVPNTTNPRAVAAATELATWCCARGLQPVLESSDAIGERVWPRSPRTLPRSVNRYWQSRSAATAPSSRRYTCSAMSTFLCSESSSGGWGF